MMASGCEWQMARQWLIDANVIPSWHRATKPTADLVDFSNCLRDGGFLCYLCNRIQPNAVRQIHNRAQRQFLCMQNINAFLICCQREFGMPLHELFDATDLYDLSDFGAVVRTLSALSKTRHAQSAGLEMFPPERYQGIDDEIYANLESDLEQRISSGAANDSKIYDVVENEEYDEEDIYGSVVPSKQKVPERSASVESKRIHVINELLDTERSYVDALQMIVDHFMHPVMNSITMEDRAKVFLNIELLLKDHKKFLDKLETSVRTGAKDISSCFISQAEDLLKYGFFCSRLPDAQDRIAVMMKDPTLEELLMRCKTRSKQRFGLKELMCVPMQRTLKYPLLIRELIKHTAEHHVDKRGLEKALEEVNHAAMRINEAKKQYEMHQTILQIQNSLIDFPGGRLIEQGDMLQDGELKVKFGETSKVKLRYVFLFDRALLICRSRGANFAFKQMLRWQEYTVHDVPATARGKWAHSWNLHGPSAAVACSLYAKTVESKQEWLRLVEAVCEKCRQEAALGSRRPSDRYVKPPDTRGPLPLPPTMNRPPMPPPGEIPSLPRETPPLPREPPLMPSAVKSTKGVVPRPAPPSRVRGFPVTAVQNYRGQPHPGGGAQVILFNKGDEITVTNQSDRDWWEGVHKKTGSSGVFPATFVKFQEELELERQRSRSRLAYEDAFPIKLQSSIDRAPAAHSPTENSAESPESIRRRYSASPWFVGRMARSEADNALASMPDGTFLVRESDNRPGDFALSIKFRQSKHIRIVMRNNMFQLSDLKQCPTIEHLIDHYKKNTLSLSFPGLETTLVHPYKNVCNAAQSRWCRVLYSFQERDREELGLEENSDVRIINKDTSRSGWWLGECNGKLGLFPSNYVKEY